MTTRRTTHVYEKRGDQTVSTAADLVSRLPNGLQLTSLTFHADNGGHLGTWLAVVKSPIEDVGP